MFTFLTERERNDPSATIKSYCADDYLNAPKALFNLFSFAMESNEVDDYDKSARTELVYSFHIFLQLLEANSLLYKMLEEEEITYTIKKPIYNETKR